MKKTRKLLCLALALALVFTLCACGGKPAEDAAPSAGAEQAADASFAGEYTAFCALFGVAYMASAFGYDGQAGDIPDQYVDYPEMEGHTVTLAADGTGYLYWGDENQGPIDWWTMDGSALRFQAGVSVIEGTIIDGFMTLKLDDGFSLCFTSPGADTSWVRPISMDAYIDLLSVAETDEGEPETAPPPELPVEGEYHMFAVKNDGYLVDAGEMDMHSALTLAAGGTGSSEFDGDAMEIVSWTAEGETLSIVMADGSAANAVAHNGVIELDIYGDGSMLVYYAQEGADISAYDLMTRSELMDAYAADAPDSRLHALWAGLDTAEGVHLRYDLRTDYADVKQSFDVHGKGDVYYSRRTTWVGEREETTVTFFRDGTAYNLSPSDMTGIVATTTTASVISDDVMMLDALYSDIRSYAAAPEYQVEEREFDGVPCTAEVFPADEYNGEAVFFFDDAGQLIGYSKGAPVTEGAADIGESVYTIHAVDGAVDETLFDISQYEITE